MYVKCMLDIYLFLLLFYFCASWIMRIDFKRNLNQSLFEYQQLVFHHVIAHGLIDLLLMGSLLWQSILELIH